MTNDGIATITSDTLDHVASGMFRVAGLGGMFGRNGLAMMMAMIQSLVASRQQNDHHSRMMALAMIAASRNAG
jgi:hypothetical protein